MNLVVLDADTLGENDLSPLEKVANVTLFPLTSDDQVVPRARDAQVIVTNKVVISEQHLEQLPNLSLICVAATGTNNVDLQAAKDHGVTVCNVAGYSTASVVQHTFSLMTMLMANAHRYVDDCANGAWQQSPMFCRLDYPLEEIADKTLTLVGYGELGQAVARVATAYGMHVCVAERQGASSIRDGRTEFNDALKQADIVSLHCPHTDETNELINADTLAMMKPSAMLINTARGGVINEQDLADALANKVIAGAALDVLSKEPAQTDNPLVKYQGDNLLLTPHIAWASRQARDRLIAQLVSNIEGFKTGQIRNQVS